MSFRCRRLFICSIRTEHLRLCLELALVHSSPPFQRLRTLEFTNLTPRTVSTSITQSGSSLIQTEPGGKPYHCLVPVGNSTQLTELQQIQTRTCSSHLSSVLLLLRYRREPLTLGQQLRSFWVSLRSRLSICSVNAELISRPLLMIGPRVSGRRFRRKNVNVRSRGCGL